jgi:predicted kinase
MLIMMAGLQGSGKSTLARQLAATLPGIVLDKDTIRAALFPPSHIEYSTAQDDFVVKLMLQVAEYLLRKEPSAYVILDGRPFSRRYQVDLVVEFATKLPAELKIIHCMASDESHKRRLESDNTHPARDRTYDLYLATKARFEPIEQPRLLVNTDEPLADCVVQCLEYIRGGERTQGLGG